METKRTVKTLDRILCLSANAALTMIALWNIASVFLEHITTNAVIARFGVAFACIAYLFPKRRPIQVTFASIAFILIAIATILYTNKI